jgi:hypothetical protein
MALDYITRETYSLTDDDTDEGHLLGVLTWPLKGDFFLISRAIHLKTAESWDS